MVTTGNMLRYDCMQSSIIECADPKHAVRQMRAAASDNAGQFRGIHMGSSMQDDSAALLVTLPTH